MIVDENGMCTLNEEDYSYHSNGRERRKTNADRIRAMTDEELAEYICKVQYREGDVCPPTHNCAVDKACVKCWLDWLKEEASE